MGVKIALLLGTSTAAAVCLLTFFAKHKRRRSLTYYMAMGVAVQFLASVPAGIYQGISFVDQTKPLPARLAMGAIAAPFHMGGLTARTVFEAVTDPYPPKPKGVVIPVAMGKFHVFLIVLLVQVGGVSWVFARRLRAKQDFSDPALFCIALAVMVNGLANAGWIWWK